MNKYVVEFSYGEKFNAGSKARDDIKTILERRGFNYLLYKSQKLSINSIGHLYYIVNNLKKRIKNESIVIIQLPILINKIYLIPLIKTLQKKNCKIIFILHDIVSLRLQKNKFKVYQEINIFNKANHIISHNKYMTRWLRENGVTVNIIDLELFDYVVDTIGSNKNNNKNEDNSIIFAGNLNKNKSGFIYQLNSYQSKFNLYGLNYDQSIKYKNINYKGTCKPDELPYKMEGKYGLIWDGNSLKECDGVFGQYIKYNNPHKLSLYISAGLPVIVWRQAAIAEFVYKNNIGLIIDSLDELDKKLRSVSKDEYCILKQNVKKLMFKVRNGEFTNIAINKALEENI